MSELNAFTIPLKGLKSGIHEYAFEITDWFFKHFPESPIKEGNFAIKLFFDKRPDMLVLTFDVKGSVKTNCDRCLTAIDLPIQDSQQLLFKYAEEAKEDAEVVYITRNTNVLNVARYIYEYICLAMPMIKVYNCEEDEQVPCNEEMLQYLDRSNISLQEEQEKQSIWDELKKFKKNN